MRDSDLVGTFYRPGIFVEAGIFVKSRFWLKSEMCQIGISA